MPEFGNAKYDDVQIGRGLKAKEETDSYVAALEVGDAGRIVLGEGDTVSRTRSRIAAASKRIGIKVRASATTEGDNRVVYWKRTEASRRGAPTQPEPEPEPSG